MNELLHHPDTECLSEATQKPTAGPVTGSAPEPRATMHPARPSENITNESTPSPGQPSADTGRPSTSPRSLQLPAVFGDYELLKELARGGMGVVYKAREISLDRVVALKMILEGMLGTDEAMERFHREARAAAGLDHPHIVPVYHSGQHEGRHFFTMAYIEGANLKQIVKRTGLPSPQGIVALLLPVVDAVEFAHQHGILHRDLKPENVMIDQQGRPRVTDFGLAKRVVGDTELTASGQILGTPCYLPPEQATGDLPRIGPTADVYGLGAILYFLLTGQPPFQGPSTSEVLCQVIMRAPVPPRQLNPQVPEGLEAICLKCLEKDPAQRYPSAAAVAVALQDWANQAGLTIPQTYISLNTVPDHAHGADKQTRQAGTTPEAGAGAPFATLQPSGQPSTAPPHTSAGMAETLEPRQPSAVPALWASSSPSRHLSARAILGILVLAAGACLAWLLWNGPKPETRPVPAPSPAKVAVLPKELRQDFRLEVEVLGGKRGPDGAIQLTEGEAVKFRIKSEDDAYVGVWTVEADGTVLQLFPNDQDREHFFRAGEARVVPETVVAEAVLSKGLDRVWVLAATAPWDPAVGQRQGPFRMFKTQQEQQAMVERVRGIRLRPAVRLADRVLEYRVGPLP